MESVEMPSLPKVMLDNLLAAMSSSSVKEPSSWNVRNGYRPLALPLLHHAGSNGESLPPLTSQDAAGYLKRETFLPFAPSLTPLRSESPIMAVEKDKKKRVRKSKACNGTEIDSRVGRLDASAVAYTTQPDSLEEPSLPPVPLKRKRPPPKATLNGYDAEKPPPRKRNRQPSRKGMLKDVQSHLPSSSELTFGSHTNHDFSKGILGIYGLNTRTMDISCHLKEVALESLISGDVGANSTILKPASSRSSVPDNSFGKRVNSILEVFAKPRNAGGTESGSNSKLFPDLEGTPVVEDKEGFQIEPKLPSYLPTEAPALENRATAFLFSPESLPHVHPIKFVDTLQLNSTTSLESLLSQATGAKEKSSSHSEIMEIDCMDERKSLMLPPLPFSKNCATLLHENASDRIANPGFNLWFRAEVPKCEPPGIKFTCGDRTMDGSSFYTNVNSEKGPARTKECLIDIDLNKELPEAEAAYSVHCSGYELKADTGHVFDVNKLHVYGASNNEMKLVTSSDTNMDPQNTDDEAKTSIGRGICVSGKRTVKDGRQTEDKLKETTAGLYSLSVPYFSENKEACNDVPCSPGVQATARLLCRMANSLTPYYSENGDGEKDASFCDKHRPTKAARITGLKAENQVGVDKLPVKVKLGDEKSKQHQEMVNVCTVASENKVSSLIHCSEPWTSTPPQGTQRSLGRTPCSQSSESDGSPNQGVREPNSRMEVHSKCSRTGITHMSVVSNKPPKEGKRNLIITTRENHLARAGSMPNGQKRGTIYEITRSGFGDTGVKFSRPRSSGKTSLQPLRTVCSSFPVKPRTSTGCPLKPPTRHFGSCTGEIRQTAK